MIHDAAPWLLWLESSWVGLAMRRSLWAYPITEIAHLVGIVALVGPAVMFDLRLLGLSRRLPVGAMARHLLPWSRRGLALVAVSGTLMFISHASQWAYLPVFRLKLTLIVLAGLNTIVFHRGVFRWVSAWDTNAQTPAAARAAAVLSLAFWVTIIACGRLLAYL